MGQAAACVASLLTGNGLGCGSIVLAFLGDLITGANNGTDAAPIVRRE